MFKNLFSYEENENVVEFVEEETIETVEELDTLLDNVKAIVINTVKAAGRVVKGVAKVVIKVAAVPVALGLYTVNSTKKYLNKRKQREKAAHKMAEYIKKYYN